MSLLSKSKPAGQKRSTVDVSIPTTQATHEVTRRFGKRFSLTRHAKVLPEGLISNPRRFNPKTMELWLERIQSFKLRGHSRIAKTLTTKHALHHERNESLLVISASELALLIRLQVESQLPRLLEEAKAKSDPMASARARGDAYKQSELANAENLTLSEAAKRTGLSEKWINTLRNRRELYALVEPGRERGFRYPAWQFDCQKGRLSSVLEALSNAGVELWGIHTFMNNASKDLQGKTPRDYIRDEKAPLEQVLKLIERRYAEEQGAQ